MEKGISASKPGLFYAACVICQVMYCSSPAALLPFPDAWREVTSPGFRSLQKCGESPGPVALGPMPDQTVLRRSSSFPWWGPALSSLWGKGVLDVRVGVCGYNQYLKGLARETEWALLSYPGGGLISARTSLPAQRLELSLGQLKPLPQQTVASAMTI